MSSTHIDSIVNKVTEELQDLRVSSNKISSDRQKLQSNAERLQRRINANNLKLERIEQCKSRLEAKREAVNRLNNSTVRDSHGEHIKIEDMVEIVNAYTSFKTTFLKSKRVRESLRRGESVTGYDSDKLREVTGIRRSYHRGTNVDMVHFITDSGFETWRISKNLLVCNGERGSLTDEAGTGEDHLFESRTD